MGIEIYILIRLTVRHYACAIGVGYPCLILACKNKI